MLKPFFASALLILSSLAHGAGFDCARASTKVEAMICGDARLSELDTQLSTRYDKALTGSTSDRVLRDQQRNWLRDVRNRCRKTDCLLSAYTRRIAEFNWVTTLAKETGLCEEFRRQQDQGAGLSGHPLEEQESRQKDFNWIIPNVDVDGDNTNDELLLDRSGSGSRIPSDLSAFTLVLSSNRKRSTIEAQHFYLFEYGSRYYLVTGDWRGEDGPLASEIYRLDRRGISKLCSFECRLPSGSCGG